MRFSLKEKANSIAQMQANCESNRMQQAPARLNLPHVLGIFWRILLSVWFPRFRIARHDDSRLTINTRLPGAFGYDSISTPVFFCCFAKVPNRSVLVLRIPVVRILLESSFF